MIPNTRVTKGAGDRRRSLPRHNTETNMQAAVSPRASGFMSTTAAGSSVRFSTTLPGGVVLPRARKLCLTMIRIPNAAKKPEIREAGTYEA